MTKTEFIHQAVISMAGGVIGSDGRTHLGDWERMMHEAERLADIVEEHSYEFDNEY